jgi:hypothetical protein
MQPIISPAALQPVRTAADYSRELNALDLQQQQMGANALNLRTGQMGLQDRERAVREGETIRNALARLGPNAAPEARISAMEGTNLPAGYAAADTLRKAMLDKRKVEAQAIKDEEDARQTAVKTGRLKLQYGIQSLQAAKAPADAISAIDNGVLQGYWDKAYADQLKSEVPQQEGKEFDAYKLRELTKIVDADKLLETHDKSQQRAQAAATAAQNARNDLIGPDGQINPQVIEAKKQIAASGAAKTQVSVNTGQKGYENESKLRNDFKSEPIYKDYADMATAHKQIKAGIASGSPIGDVATATKIMKLLDPGSVVRESELAIAMAAGGRLDRLQNFVELQLKGEKLTPTQRKEFGALSDELMEAAGQAYNKKRAEYAEFGKNYKLDDKVLGAPYVPQPAKAAPKEGEFTDAEKEKRYQEWKAKQK